MRRFFHSPFFYPVLMMLLLTTGAWVLYAYTLSEVEEILIEQATREAQENGTHLQDAVEAFSMSREPIEIQRAVSREASKKKITQVLLIAPDDTIVYANHFKDIGLSSSEVLTQEWSKHYREEFDSTPSLGAHIHQGDETQVHALLRLDYLYDPRKDIRHDNGILLLRYDITPQFLIISKELREELLLVFGSMALLFILLFYFYHRNYLKKLIRLQALSTDLLPEYDISKNGGIDTITDSLYKATRELALLSRVFQQSNDAILITDDKRRIISVNPAFERLSGYQADEVIGLTPSILKSGLIDEQVFAHLNKTLQREGKWEGELIDRSKDGSSYPIWTSIWSIKDTMTQEVSNYVAVNKDLTTLLRKQKQIEKLAYTDMLTDIANRTNFLQQLERFITHSDRNNNRFALLFFDVDDFKEINDTSGHKMGDLLLQHLAKRVQGHLRSEDMFARLGGDEFIIAALDIERPEDALRLATHLIELFDTPFTIEDRSLHISISVGIALYPDDGKSSKKLLAAADLAMYRSKEDGKNLCTLFQKEMQEKALADVQIRRELTAALEQRQFELYYQPKVDTKSKKITGFEALIRWNHPTRGLVPPIEFIPIAEESGLVIPMTEWIFSEVYAFFDRLIDAGFPNILLAINISARHFVQDSLIELVEKFSHTHKEYHHQIELEVTESAIMQDINDATRQLNTLHDLGLKVALDDFGTGYSSLAYLKNLPIDTIKIDRTFVMGIMDGDKDRAIIESTVILAKKLGMKTVAEGVEHQEEADYLLALGCDRIQGYLYSRPLPADEALALLKESLHGV